MNPLVFYLIGFLVIVFIARMLGEKAVKHLDTEQKAGLIDLFTKERKYSFLAIMCVVIAFLVVLQFRLVKPIVAFGVYFGLMVLFVIFKNYNSYTKLTAHNYPAEYIRKILIANIVAVIGIILFFVMIFFTFLQHRG